MKPHAILVTLALVIAAPLGICAAAPAAYAQDQVFTLDLSGTRPALPVAIGDRPAELWIFDTGAQGNVVEIERARTWQLPNNGAAQIGSPIGGEPAQGFRTNIEGARIGDRTLPPFNAVAMPLPPRLDRAGVLSPNMFRGQLVTLDFARTELRVSEKNATNLPAGEGTPYTGAHPLPAMNVSVGDQTYSAHLDTGAPHVLVFPYSMAASLPLDAPPEVAGVAHFVDGVRTRYRGRINGTVQVGPLTLTNPEVGFIDGLPFLNVGMGALSQMRVTLDPEARLSWAELIG
jgi:hypothetical protein